MQEFNQREPNRCAVSNGDVAPGMAAGEEYEAWIPVRTTILHIGTESLVYFGYRRTAFFVLLCLSTLSFLALSSTTNMGLELMFKDSFLRWNIQRTRPDPRILLVAVDNESLLRIPQRWPWPRAVFSRLIEAISKAGARFILIDILFLHPDPSDNGKGDQMLARTLEQSGNIGLVSLIEELETKDGLTIRHSRSFPEIRRKASLEGFARSIIDSDGKVRSFVFHDRRLEEDALVYEMARELSSTSFTLATDSEILTKRFISFPAPHDPYPFVSAGDILDGNFAPELFKGKIVVLGATAEALHDYHSTILGVMSGPEILAATLDTLLKGEVRQEKSGLGWRLGSMALGLLAVLLLYGRTRMLLKGVMVWGCGYLVCGLSFLSLQCYIPLAPFSWTLFGSIVGILSLEGLLNILKLQTSKAEGEAARIIQRELFPSPVMTVGDYVIRTLNIPCEDVGGDFCDVQVIDEKTVFFLLGDVSGHGVSAALVTAMAKTSIEILRQARVFSASAFLFHFNELLKNQLKKKRMMTAILGTIDISRHDVNVHFAGHQFPLLMRSDGTIGELAEKSNPIGIAKKPVFPELVLSLQPGESLIIYTDGIVEATNWDGTEFGYERWIASLKKSIPELPVSADLSSLLGDVRKHVQGKPFGDDVTILVMQRMRPASSAHEVIVETRIT